MEQVKDIILKVIADLSAGRLSTQEKIFNLWGELSDKKTFKHTKIVGFDKGELIINVDSPARLFQINLQKRKILDVFKKQIPELTHIRFKIGKVT